MTKLPCLTLPAPWLGLLYPSTMEEKTFPSEMELATTSILPLSTFLIINFHGTIKHFPTKSSAEHTDRAKYIERFRSGVFCLAGLLKLLTFSGKFPLTLEQFGFHQVCGLSMCDYVLCEVRLDLVLKGKQVAKIQQTLPNSYIYSN